MEKLLSSSQLASALTPTQIRYLKEVLGVEQILWGKPRSEVASMGPCMAVFVSKMNTSERELFNKMLGAMKLSSNDYHVVEEPMNEEYKQLLSQAPIVALVFGFELAKSLNIEFTRGKFSSQEGVATIVTYGPADLSKNPELKSETWKDMKLALQRLGPA